MVVDLLENLDKGKIRIEENMDGFNFSVEMAKLTPKTRQIAIEVFFNKALREIGGLPAQVSSGSA